MDETDRTNLTQDELDDEELERVAGGTIAGEAGLKKLSGGPLPPTTSSSNHEESDSEDEVVDYQGGDNLLESK